MQHFKDKIGRQLNPISPIFPILTGNNNNKTFKFIGTGFFINTFGGFLTAKHVLYDINNNPINPFYAIITHDNKQYISYLNRSFYHPFADICFGILRNYAHVGEVSVNFDFQTPVMQLLENEPQIGDVIQTFAYPNSQISFKEGEQWGNFVGEWFNGKISNIIPYRDKTFYPYKIFESDMSILPGASGAPVMKNAYVIGINSSSFDFGDSENNLSYITPIKFAYDIEVELNGEKFKLGDKKIKTVKKN